MNWLEILLHSTTFLAASSLVLIFANQLESRVEEIKEAKSQSSGDTLAELYVQMSPQTFMLLRVLASALAFLLGFALLGIGLGAMLFLAAFITPHFQLKRLKEKRVKLVEQQLIEGLELLGSSLKSGLTLPQAIELLVNEFPPPISQEFSLILSETRLGVDFADSLERMAERLGSNIIHILSSGIRITKQCGGDLAEIFSNIADTIREQANIEGKLNAVTAQGRFQGVILGLLPFGLIIILYFVDRTHVETLFKYQLGLAAVAAVVIMVGLAQVWIRQLLKIDV